MNKPSVFTKLIMKSIKLYYSNRFNATRDNRKINLEHPHSGPGISEIDQN